MNFDDLHRHAFAWADGAGLPLTEANEYADWFARQWDGQEMHDGVTHPREHAFWRGNFAPLHI